MPNTSGRNCGVAQVENGGTVMFRVEMLPAQQGDALWIEYGSEGSVHRVLVDGGTPPTYQLLKQRIEALPAEDRVFDLFIITHVDTDHIGGALKLLADPALGATFHDVWFNDWDDLPPCPNPSRGPVDGAIMTRVLQGLGIQRNRAFAGLPAVVPDQGALPGPHRLPGGMVLTLLSPGVPQLANLQCTWTRALRKAGLEDPAHPDMDKLNEKARRKGVRIPRGLASREVEELADAAFVADRARANGSTIAVLAEYGGRSCLLAGDAFPSVLTSSLERLRTARGGASLAVDAFKLPHHGSRRNVSLELLGAVDCATYLFSTDGSVHEHPDRQAVARVLRYGGPAPTLAFNYCSDQNRIWDDEGLMEQFGYRVRYPQDGQAGLVIDLDALPVAAAPQTGLEGGSA
jgi:Metallo-beta-lactamase superfamily